MLLELRMALQDVLMIQTTTAQLCISVGASSGTLLFCIVAYNDLHILTVNFPQSNVPCEDCFE